MKKFIRPAILLISFALTTAFAMGQAKETRNVRNFTKVSYGISGELILRIGPCKIEIAGLFADNPDHAIILNLYYG
ncbi:MAG: hypothetical protein WAW07_12685 [Bacteroidales bacterium]